MLRSFITKLRSRALEEPHPPKPRLSFVLHQFVDADGKFAYDKYREIQQAGNKAKIDLVWVLQENIEFLAGYLSNYLGRPSFGICHGTRQGEEQKWFTEALGCPVIGTEISNTASDFPSTIQWDFHETKPEWLNNVDFIYSNSFDHSYDPEACLNAWMSCIKPSGLCILEHTTLHGAEGASALDPFGADLHLMPYLILLWGKGRYSVRELLTAPNHRQDVKDTTFIVIQKNSAPVRE